MFVTSGQYVPVVVPYMTLPNSQPITVYAPVVEPYKVGLSVSLFLIKSKLPNVS